MKIKITYFCFAIYVILSKEKYVKNLLFSFKRFVCFIITNYPAIKHNTSRFFPNFPWLPRISLVRSKLFSQLVKIHRYVCNSSESDCPIDPHSAMETPYPIPVTPTKTRIGWIGIGVMGAAMATRLLSAGYSVAIYARTPSKALDLQSKGARLLNSAVEVARTSDVVFTMVGHPSDVRQNVLENNGLLQGLNPGGVVVDTTSSHPALAREIFAAARAKGWVKLSTVYLIIYLYS